VPKPKHKISAGHPENAAELQDLGDGRYRIEGPLDYFTATTILEESEEKFESYATIEVDLGGVTDTGSAGLALLLEWVNWAKNYVREIRFLNVPEQIQSLADISEVDAFIRSGERWTGLPK
jgi:phospholipid transport system transporter-binding protein